MKPVETLRAAVVLLNSGVEHCGAKGEAHHHFAANGELTALLRPALARALASWLDEAAGRLERHLPRWTGTSGGVLGEYPPVVRTEADTGAAGRAGGRMIDTFEASARAIIRCVAKKCRAVRRVEFTTGVITTACDGRPHERRTVTLPGGRTVPYRDRLDLRWLLTAGFACESCGGTNCEFALVEGVVVDGVRCGARCRNAVGGSCDCECGGTNHATGHASVVGRP